MRKRVIALLLAALVTGVGIASAATAEWSTVAAMVRQSIVEIAVGDEGGCTGFVIDNEKDYVLTAAHCDGEKLMVDLLPAKVKSKDVKNDLMVLVVEGIDRPALKLAGANPKIGEEVASYGYGYALDQPLFRVTHVSAVNVNIQERVQYLAVDATFVPGQSGGPVVNQRGELVMIVQLGSQAVGFGVGAEQIHDRVGRFFASAK